jgi:hypothetical protein
MRSGTENGGTALGKAYIASSDMARSERQHQLRQRLEQAHDAHLRRAHTGSNGSVCPIPNMLCPRQETLLMSLDLRASKQRIGVQFRLPRTVLSSRPCTS